MTATALTVFTMVLFSISTLPKLNSFSVVVSNARRASKLSRCVSMRGMSMKTDDVSGPETQRLINQASAWCALNGLLYSAGDMKFTMAPVSLIPNSFSKSSFEYAQNVQPILNELVDKISRDKMFLTQNLQSVGESDKFVRRLLGNILTSLFYAAYEQHSSHIEYSHVLLHSIYHIVILRSHLFHSDETIFQHSICLQLCHRILIIWYYCRYI